MTACPCPRNEHGDIRCHNCGEYVNVRCWNCRTPRGEGPCPMDPYNRPRKIGFAIGSTIEEVISGLQRMVDVEQIALTDRLTKGRVRPSNPFDLADRGAFLFVVEPITETEGVPE